MTDNLKDCRECVNYGICTLDIGYFRPKFYMNKKVPTVDGKICECEKWEKS